VRAVGFLPLQPVPRPAIAGSAGGAASGRRQTPSCRRPGRGPTSSPSRSRRPGSKRCCCRPASCRPSSPARISGTPWASSSDVSWFAAQQSPPRQNRGILGCSFGTAIQAVVVVGAVAVVFLVGLVVLVLVADQIGEREAVVNGDVIDAGLRPAPIVMELRRRTGQRAGHVAEQAAIATPIAPQRSAVDGRSTPTSRAESRRPDSRQGRCPMVRRSS